MIVLIKLGVKMIVSKNLWKIIPFVACIAIAIILFSVSYLFTEDIKTLFQGLASSFFSIPLMFLGYDWVKNKAENKLNKELFDYAKMQIDAELLAILDQAQKLLFSYDEIDRSLTGIDKTLHLTNDEIFYKMKNMKLLGFQILKRWELPEKHITEILGNNYILQRLDRSQIMALIDVLKSIRSLTIFQAQNRNDIPFVKTKEMAKNYKILHPSTNPASTEYPDRYILIEKITDSKGIVVDFGDFCKQDTETLLSIYNIRPEFCEFFSSSIYSIVSSISHWGSITGNEFIIDLKKSRIRKVS